MLKIALNQYSTRPDRSTGSKRTESNDYFWSWDLKDHARYMRDILGSALPSPSIGIMIV